MADYANHMSYTVDLNKPITKTIWHDLFVTTSKKAHRIELQLRRGTENINFDGDVTATLITYADMLTQEATGTSEDGKAVFVFPDSFYRQNGLFSVVIFINDGETRTPVFCGEGNMRAGETDTRYDPDGVVPSLSEVLAQIDAARAAANAANKAAQDAGDAAQAANDAAQAANDAGEKVDQMTASAVELPYDKQPTVETDLLDGHYHLTFGIPKGDPYTIKGHAYATLADLQAAVTNPTEGDQYNVGSAPPYNVYRWTGSSWENQGVLQGVKGDKGDKGDPGQMGATPEKGIDYWTEEDKAEIVEEVIESTKGLTDDNLDLLWSNINHSTAFAAQVVSLPALADYKIIAIRFKGYVSFTEYSPLILYQADDTRTIGTVVSATTENIFARPVTINKAAQTVTFGSGSKNGDTMAYNDNKFAIPVEIYGVRWGGGSGGSGGGASDEAVEELERQIEDIRSVVNQKADVFDDTARGGVLEVNVAIAAPAEKLVSYIEPAQAGSGDPSPENIRTITPWESVSVTNETSGETLAAELNQPVYGGVLDWTTGVLTIDRQITTIGALTVAHSVTGYQNYTLSGFPNALLLGDDVVTAVSDRFKGMTKNTISSSTDNYLWSSTASPTQIRLKCANYDMSAADFKASFADVQIVYRLAEPYTIQLTPQQMQMLKGQNTLQSNCGDTEVTYFVNTKYYIDKKFAQIAAAILSK